MRTLGYFLALAIGIGGGLFFFSTGDQAQSATPDAAQHMPATPVSVSEAITREITAWTSFSGRIEPMQRVEVRPRVSGMIKKVHFSDGSLVKEGEMLFTIDPAPYEAEVMRTQGLVTAAESMLSNAKTEDDRARRLFDGKAISQRELDTRASDLSSAEGALATAKGQLALAKLNLSYTAVKAPVSGKVSRAEITVGNIVQQGQSILTTIVSVDPVYVGFEVDERTFLRFIRGRAADTDLAKIPVSIGLASDDGTPYPAQIHSFDNEMNVESGTIRVRATAANPEGDLVSGLFARVRIGSPEKREALLINEKAIGSDQGKKFVLVVNAQNMVEYREVTPGIMTEDGLRAIDSGLAAGDRVIVNGMARVRPGMPVAAEEVDMLSLQGAQGAPAQGDAMSAPEQDDPATPSAAE